MPVTGLLYFLTQLLLTGETLSFKVSLLFLISEIIISLFIGLVVIIVLSTNETKQLNNFYSIVSKLSNESILITDKHNVITYANEKFLEMTGYTLSDLIGNKPSILKSGVQNAEFYDSMWQELYAKDYFEGEIWDKRKNGEVYPKRIRIIRIKDKHDQVRFHLSLHSDITDYKKLETEKNRHEFYSDETNLFNEKWLVKDLESRLHTVTNFEIFVAKVVNRHQIEARIGREGYINTIIQFQRRIKQHFTNKQVFGEIDKNTFLFGSEYDQSVDVTKVLSLLSTNFTYNDIMVNLEFKYGSSNYPNNAISIKELISKAQMAVNYAIENTEIVFYRYDDSLEKRLLREFELLASMADSIEQDHFLVYYQPQIDMIKRKVYSVEALIRWSHPRLGVIGPDEFIPIAEKYGYIHKLDCLVAKKAIQDHLRLRSKGHHLSISINVSPVELANNAYYTFIKNEIDHHDFPKRELTIELTEGISLFDVNHLIEYAMKLRALGVNVSLDDFGTGFNSLASMMDMKLDEIKIDRSFIKDYPNHSGNLTKSVISMGLLLGLKVVVEGIETETQKQFVIDNGARYLQGYLFSKPLPINELLDYLEHFKID